VAAESPDQVLKLFRENSQKIKSLKTTMIQEIKRGENYNYIKAEMCSKGKKIFIKVPPPQDFTLVTNGQKAYFYLPQENTVYVYDPGQYPREYQDALEQQKEKVDLVPDWKRVGNERQGWNVLEVWEGRPAGQDQFVSRIQIWIDPASGLLYRMETFDLHGKLVNRIRMERYRQINGVWLNMRTLSWTRADNLVVESTSEYRDPQVNVEIDDSLFEFSPPAGAKIKDMTAQILDKKKN